MFALILLVAAVPGCICGVGYGGAIPCGPGSGYVLDAEDEPPTTLAVAYE